MANRNLQWLRKFSIRLLHLHEHNDNIGAEKNHLEKRWFVDSMGGRYQVWTNMATKSATSRTWVICNRWSWSTGLFQCCTQRIMIKIQLARPSNKKMPFQPKSKPLIVEHYPPDCLITWWPCCISLKNIWSKCIALLQTPFVGSWDRLRDKLDPGVFTVRFVVMK